jgi:hypothetical protein
MVHRLGAYDIGRLCQGIMTWSMAGVKSPKPLSSACHEETGIDILRDHGGGV